MKTSRSKLAASVGELARELELIKPSYVIRDMEVLRAICNCLIEVGRALEAEGCSDESA